MPKVNTCLSFDGTAAEAMRFNEKVLGAKLDILMKVSDVPERRIIDACGQCR